jgi:hypothetical protein
MQTISNRFHAELEKRLKSEVETLKTNLASGMAIQTMADYQKIVGQIYAYNRVIDLHCPEIETLLEQR